jgi:hypothetical protein
MQTHGPVKTQRSQFPICQRNQSNTMFRPASGRWLLVVVLRKTPNSDGDELNLARGENDLLKSAQLAALASQTQPDLF